MSGNDKITYMKPFQIHFSDKQLADLHARIAQTRFPVPTANNNWELGTDLEYLTELLDYWRTQYNWKATEEKLNQYPQFACEINGCTIHFFHIRSKKAGATPLLLTHGWPDSFLRYVKLFPLLTDYDLIVPSLPGFAFSTLPPKGFINNAEIADLWHILMTEKLGYTSYIASGGDMGRGVTCYLAANYPSEVKGIHLTDVGFARELVNAPDANLSPAELDYKRKALEWLAKECAYIQIHSTKPTTLGYALSDSPVAMAAWLIEKYHAWSDWALFNKDDLCDCLTLYWLTNTASTSIRVYHGNTFTLPALGKITIPTAITAFACDVLPVLRSWIEKNYSVVLYEEVPHGGHFTALEQPEVFADNIRKFTAILSK